MCEWDRPKVMSVFMEAEMDRICNIPLGAAVRKDMLAWRFTKGWGLHSQVGIL